MLLKSENKMLEEITALSNKEIFRAYYKAIIKGNIGFCISLSQRLSSDKRWALSNTHLLSLLKLMGLQLILLNKASLAVSFYNSLLSEFLGKDYPKELYGKKYTEDRLRGVQTLKKKIEELDTRTNGTLELDEYAFGDEIETEFDYWIELGEDLLDKIKDITLCSEVKQKGLEQF